MARARPQWWDEAGAACQLSGTELTTGTVGWLLGRDEAHPAGWLLCRELFLYRCLEAVSYTHLDVYKRQPVRRAVRRAFWPRLPMARLS